MALGKRMRGGFAALLSAALITSGALLAAPAAYAETGAATATEAAAPQTSEESANPTPAAAEVAPAPVAAVPSEQAAAQSEPQPQAIVPLAVAPALAVDAVTSADEQIQVRVSGTGFDAVQPLPGQPAPHVYLALLERGADLATVGQGGSVPNVSVAVANGAIAGVLTQKIAQLDRAKSYQVIAWPSRSNPTEATLYARVDVTIDWDTLLPTPTETPKLTVSPASGLAATGTTVTVSGSGYNPAQPIYVFLCSDTALPTDLFAHAAACRDGAKVVYAATETNPSRLKFSADGTFELQFDVKQLKGGPTAVFTAADHTAPQDRSQDAKVALSFAGTPALTVAVTETPDTKVDVRVAGTGFEAVQPLPGQSAPHLYLALIEKGMDLSGFGQESDVPNISVEVANGAISGTLTQVVAKLDRSKSYQVIAWPSRSNPTEATLYARADAVINWDRLLPSGAITGTAALNSFSPAGIVVTAALDNLRAADYPAGIQLGVVLRGSTAVLGQAATVATIPASGSVTRDLSVPRELLESGRQYDVIAWPANSSASDRNLIRVLQFTISGAQWLTIFPPAPQAPGAGSLTWGISSSFASYVTGSIAKGSIATSGVGGGRGGYVFPQATGSVWNAETRTGTVYYSGTVTFLGHGGLLNEVFANPVITVTSPISGSISSSGRSFPLNLAGASFTANADGSVTWSGVTVNGAITGGNGAGAGGSLGLDPLSFTVGSASGIDFGSTNSVSKFAQKRTAAAAPPATTGLTVVTQAEKLLAGGEIELTASGFEPNEQGILVVLYSEPTVLDTNAKADANGVVRWLGKLPKDIEGKHTITLQGSINVGQEITIAPAATAVAPKGKKSTAQAATSGAVAEAAIAAAVAETPAWAWWAGALGLLAAAGVSTGLVVAQRRRNAAPTHL